MTLCIESTGTSQNTPFREAFVVHEGTNFWFHQSCEREWERVADGIDMKGGGLFGDGGGFG